MEERKRAGIDLLVVWEVAGGWMVAVGGDGRGMVMEVGVEREAEEDEWQSAVERAWKDSVDTVLQLVKLYHRVQAVTLTLIHWREDDEADRWTRPEPNAEPDASIDRQWVALLERRGFHLVGSASSQSSSGEKATAMEVDDAVKERGAGVSSLVTHVRVCGLQPSSSTRFLRVTQPPPSSAAATGASAAPSSVALVVEGINASGHSSLLVQSPQLVTATQPSPPLASLLLFPHHPSDATHSPLSRHPPPPLPV